MRLKYTFKEQSYKVISQIDMRVVLYAFTDYLRMFILFANSISAEDIERSKVLCDETV